MAFINNSKLADCALAGVGQEGVDIYTVMAEADVIFVPRANNEIMLKMVDIYQEAGKKVVLDHDDDVFNVNPFSPHYEDYGTEEVEIIWEGKKVKLWEDGRVGKNGKVFSLEENRKKQAVAVECIKRADALSVTTKDLKKVFSHLNNNIYVLPNCLDFSRWRKLPLIKDKTIRIGWHGGASHYQDWLAVLGPLKKILKKNKNVKFVACGHEFRGLVDDIPKEQYEYHNWVPTMAHPYFQAGLNLDLAIVPIKKDVFNSGKSSIKWVEYSALKIPCVVTDYPPYNRVVKNYENGILYNTTREFKDAVQALIDNSSLRYDIGNKAYETVTRDFDAVKTAPLWADMFKEVHERKIIAA